MQAHGPARLIRRLIRFPAVQRVAMWLTAIAVFMSAGERAFVYDSLNYWTIAGQFRSDEGGFTATGYDDELRGYSWPLVLYVCQRVALLLGIAPETAVLLLNSALLALLGVVLLPALAARLLDGSAHWCVAPAVCVLALRVLWGGYAPYPLTDVPAVVLLVAAALLLWQPTVVRCLSGGLAVGLATNMRPAFLAACAVAVAAGAWQRASRESRRRLTVHVQRFVLAACVMVGIAAALVPQAAINVVVHDRASPLPLRSGDIAKLQFAEGLRYQKYATTLDGTRGDPGIFYCDPAGARLLATAVRENAALTSPTEYVRFMAQHPFQAAGVVGRRLSNGLFNDSPTPYLPGRTPGPALGVLAVLVISAGTVVASRRVRTPRRLVLLLLVLSPSFSAVTAIVETRFFFSVSVLCIAIVAHVVGTSADTSLRRLLRTAVMTALIAVPILVIAGSANALEGAPRTATQGNGCARYEGAALAVP